MNIESDDRKKAMLLHTVGPKTHDTFLSLLDQGTTYNEAKHALTNYFMPKVSLEYEKAVFKSLRQKSGEKIDAYHSRCRQAAATCGLGSNDRVNTEIKSHIIQTTTDQKVRKLGLKNNALTLD